MSIIKNYLEDKWNEEGLIPKQHVIEEDLEHLITHDQALDIPMIVSGFVQHIIWEEGRVEFEAVEKPKKRTESARI